MTNCYYLLVVRPGVIPTWNESSQGLVVLVPIPVGLPPVGVILADDVEDVSLLEGQAKLSTRHKGVVRGVIVEVSSYVRLRRIYRRVVVAELCQVFLTHTHPCIWDLPQCVCEEVV